MMIKFLAHGTGSAAKAADYLTRERFPARDQEQDQDQEKNPEEVKVLRGHPDQVAAVADSLGVRAQVHLGRDRLVAGGCPERRANRTGGGRVRENRLGRAGGGPLRLVGHRAPRSGRRGPRACPGGASGSGDRQEPEYRGTGLAEDV